mmetsp:Transcript_39486/g.106814  ORF Transcript_39486/g.106814 Transcript_39486/m.106814 type:complete len:248 (+) Transcript_39486:1438-2181(+)
MSALGTTSGSFGTTREWQYEAMGVLLLSVASAAAAFFTPKDIIFPPKPNDTPHGFLYQRGQYFVPAFCCCCTEWMLTEPLKEAVEMIEGLCGAHFTSKFDCNDCISQKVSILPSLLLQHIRRLSLPQDRMRFGSCVFQATPRMPLEWPAVSLNGYVQFRRSHIWIAGCRSSSYATSNCVGTSGCHSTPEMRWRLAGSWKLITSFFCFRSQTTVVPVLEQEHRMCWTFLFQAQHSTSEPACLLLSEGW